MTPGLSAHRAVWSPTGPAGTGGLEPRWFIPSRLICA